MQLFKGSKEIKFYQKAEVAIYPCISERKKRLSLSPVQKLQKMAQITEEQRYTIFRMQQAGKTRKEICIAIGKDKSVLSRELQRNVGKRGGYTPAHAQELASERKLWKKHSRKFTASLQKEVSKYISEEQWSPEQIVGWSKKNGKEMVSHERIYQFIRADKKAGGTLWKHLRHKGKHRKRPVGGKKIIIPDKVSIDLRPEVINNKERFGDFEIDTVVGPENKGAILTVTERLTGFLLMKKLPYGKNAKELALTLYYMLLPYKQFVKSITSDNGTEFYEHKLIAKKLDVQYFFAHPYASWERGLNEYTNGLIRQYIPKKQSLANYSDEDILNFQHKINNRPRKILNFANPKDWFFMYINQKVAFDT